MACVSDTRASTDTFAPLQSVHVPVEIAGDVLRAGGRGVGVWIVTKDGDPRALALADRHYSRGKPGTPLFVGPGRKIVLVSEDGLALWATRHSLYRRDGRTGWECVMFRNEGPWLSSHLIVLALGVTRYLWGDPPAEGMFTFVGHRLRGGCFYAAGFHKDGATADGRLCLRLQADHWPPSIQPARAGLFAEEMSL